ncbi:MAG: LysM domain-containing protein [Anaerolineae bacterium]
MFRKLFVILLLLACSIAAVHAQSADCPDIVEQALKPVGSVCDPLNRNAACYGSNSVNTVTVAPQPENFFSAPGDMSELQAFREIHPQPMDAIAKTFGVAVLNIQANVPNTLPGQAVLFMLVGDARLTNEVSPDSTDQTPFQSFYFLPSAGGLNCYESEPILTIQSPGNIAVTMHFNGVDTEFSPGTLLTITPSVCTIHRGGIIQRVDNQIAGNLLANQTIDINITEEGNIVVNNLRGISRREYDRGLLIQDALNSVSISNGWSEQLITLPRGFAEEPSDTAVVSEPTCGAEHVVVTGDTLFKIAQRYNTSMQSIIDANSIIDPRLIRPGDKLCIPTPDSGFVALP